MAKCSPILTWLDPYYLENGSILDGLCTSRLYAKGIMLDVRCGNGRYRHLFEDRIEEYVGIDRFDLKLISFQSGFLRVCGDAQDLPIATCSVDTVYAHKRSNTYQNQNGFFEEIARVLRRGGALILTAPQTWGIHLSPYDFYRYTKFGLIYLAESSGLRVKQILPRGGFWLLFGQGLLGKLFLPFAKFNMMIQLPVRVVCSMVQVFFLLLDGLNHLPDDTLGYVMVATRP